MKSPSNEVLLEKIEQLYKKVEEGFEGVHERQDTTNGKVLANTEWRLQQIGRQEQRDRDQASLKWVLGFIGVGQLVGLLKLFTNLF